MNIDTIHNTMLDNISDDYQKTEGFPTYDITRGFAFALLVLWKKAEEIEMKQNVDNLTGDELETFVAQRKGTIRKQATYAEGVLTIVEGNGTIHVGDLFESEGGIKYESLETKDVMNGSTVKIRCTQAGSAGNVAANVITKMPITIQGIISVTNQKPIVGGENTETDNDLRERYYEELREPATSGNKYHYKEWAKEVTGVGEANVIDTWQGKGTVKIVIINADRQAASESLVNDVQEYIDPHKNGDGAGEAPMGAVCTVVSATNIPININVTGIVTNGNVAESEIRDALAKKVESYLKEIAFKQNYVSAAQIASFVIGLDYIKDYDTCTINGDNKKVTLSDEEVAVKGTIEVHISG